MNDPQLFLLTYCLIYISLLLGAAAHKEWKDLQDHLRLVKTLEAWAPLWGVQWEDGEPALAFQQRLLSTMRSPCISDLTKYQKCST